MAPRQHPCALVIGGGRGIGAEAACALARRGHDVVVAARTASELDATCARLGDIAPDGHHLAITCDIRRDDQARALFQRVEAVMGRLDLLVNAQGAAMLGNTAGTTPAVFDEMLTANLSGVFRAVHLARPALARSRGTIINIISRAGRQPYPNALAYGTAKAGLVYLTRALAMDLGPAGIRVLGISPGAVATRLRRDVFPDEDPSRLMRPEAVAAALAGLLDPAFADAGGTIIDLPW
ncbi:SDR family oxidoreductase (plasmid) [Tistrella bauzanensis]|uniref:SDR family NAD(P)-dependent oxidoreductase n=1 Tax=Tistrella TaxID=171436 RepID=UPI0031F6FA1D